MREIFSDNHVLVLEKPAGISTQPEFHEMAKAYIKEKHQKPGNVFLEPIHRLDKPVSGMVLFARTSKALKRLNGFMRERQIKKKYLAWVEGNIEAEGTLTHTLSHGNFRALVDKEGKLAVLHYRLLEKKRGNSLVEIDLETGRYHQIRAQFSAIGHPVLGDQKYGAKGKREKIALHHHVLSFPHPITNEILTCQCPAGDFA